MECLIASVLVLLLTACGGGGGSAPPPPPPTVITATFTPAAPPGGAAVLLGGPSGAQQSTITLDVNAQALPSSTYALAFDLDFDATLLSYAGHQAGTFFEAGGPVSYQVTTSPANAGKLIVGVSLQGRPSGVSGSGRVLSLRFNIQNNQGTTSLVFSGNSVLDTNGQPMGGVSWAAGSVQNRR